MQPPPSASQAPHASPPLRRSSMRPHAPGPRSLRSLRRATTAATPAAPSPRARSQGAKSSTQHWSRSLEREQQQQEIQPRRCRFSAAADPDLLFLLPLLAAPPRRPPTSSTAWASSSAAATPPSARGARYQPMVDAVNALEALDRPPSRDADLKAKTAELRERALAGASLDDLLPEAFAVVREASKRVLGLRPFDVQLIGGAVLHGGQVAEMRTGEGKTLVAVMPAYLNALTGRGVHVVTVNDYLARRDSEWVGQVHKFLGLSVGLVQSGLDERERKEAYNCDVTYVTNSELGFDYLRDNLASSADDLVLRVSGFNFCVIDEVDSILIDEARRR